MIAVGLCVVLWLHPSLGYAPPGTVIADAVLRWGLMQVHEWLFLAMLAMLAMLASATVVVALLPSATPRALWCRTRSAWWSRTGAAGSSSDTIEIAWGRGQPLRSWSWDCSSWFEALAWRPSPARALKTGLTPGPEGAPMIEVGSWPSGLTGCLRLAPHGALTPRRRQIRTSAAPARGDLMCSAARAIKFHPRRNSSGHPSHYLDMRTNPFHLLPLSLSTVAAAAAPMRKSSLTVAIAAALLSGVACDPAEGEDDEELALQQEAVTVAAGGPLGPTIAELPRAHLTAPLTATVELPGEVLVEYYDHFDGTVAVFVEGPGDMNLDGAMLQVHSSIAEATSGVEAGRKLEQIRDGLVDMPLRSGVVATGQPGSDVWTNRPQDPSFVANDGITAGGPGNLAFNLGNSDLYTRNMGATTSWWGEDMIAYGGHVSSQDGDFHWNVQKENWGPDDYYYAMTKDRLVASGQQAYFVTSNKENDFNIISTVKALDNNSHHHHDVGLCHDWNSRTSTFGSSLAGGCYIIAGISSPSVDFCTELGYFGADPSNIPTGSSWGGNGTPMSC